MKNTLTEKILKDHLLEGDLSGDEIKIKIDQTLTQDSTGTMCYLQLNALEIDQVKTESVAYIDHNMLQQGFENADDHAFIKSCAEKYGILFSKPGGGICHQVQLERFAKPGKTLIGSDSHTPTAGGIGSLAMGAGGLDVAVGMANGYYYLPVPKVYGVHLVGSLPKNCNGKDVILTILQKLTVKGGVGYIMEYFGPGVEKLTVTDRGTICNMGAELGATTSIFPSDENTLAFLKSQGREEDYVPLSAGSQAKYDKVLELDLSTIEPMIALPDSPDKVVAVREIEGRKIDQICIGSCTNSSYTDLMKAAKILEGKQIDEDIDLVISPGSASIMSIMAENGALATFIEAGARILEVGCGPCIGMGQAPKGEGVSLRTFNRNFKGRSGTMDAGVFLVSPETAAFSAITGEITNPQDFDPVMVKELEEWIHNDSYFIEPSFKDDIQLGKNIKPFPETSPLEDVIEKKVLLKLGDHITTDDICPSHAALLPLRSNIPELAKYSFTTITSTFHDEALEEKGGFIVAGENYGQGSSREHAALIPLYLGIKAVLAKSFARIHRQNLINNGILPLVFKNEEDYDSIDQGDILELEGLVEKVKNGDIITVKNRTKDEAYELTFDSSKRHRQVMISGGFLNEAKKDVVRNDG